MESTNSISFDDYQSFITQSFITPVAHVDISIVEEHPHSVDKGKAPASPERQPQVDILPNLLREVPLLPKISDEEVSILLSENVELRAKKTSFVQTVAKKKSLNIDIDSAKSKLNQLSAEIMVEDSILFCLESEIKELQAKIDDYKMRLATKKRNISLEIERTKAMMARYSELVADDPDAVMETLSIVNTRQHSEWSKLRDQMQFVLEELNL
ncbi:Uncharacterized protein Adt_42022 [Abeliophyllum distichum]|uniref:Uncharacterized protein n=1 Tax=Abeliophyllum distichum TaxID=126358 RepID=A0ABD1PQI0_9LAMI